MSKVAEKPTEKAAEKTKEPKEVPFEQVLGALEQRVEGLADRIRELVAERDRSRKELQDLRKASEVHGQAADRLEKLEAEREQVRARIERLLNELERAEAPSAEA